MSDYPPNPEASRRSFSLRLCYAVALTVLVTCAFATPSLAQTRKFDFGSRTPNPGWTQVSPSSLYTRDRGFGFEPGAKLAEVANDSKEKIRGRGIASTTPFFFSVAVPEGNYRVTVTLGASVTENLTTIKAELRRLMVENVRVTPSALKTVTFVVNVRTPAIKGGGEVRLKDREKTTEIWAWDEKLTLEFNGPHPILCALEITRVDIPTIFLLGDSTVCDQPREPYNSWGQMLTRFFKPTAAVANHAESGESIKSSLSARRFDKVFSEMRPGDYLFLQFGHNDQKEKGEGVGAMTTYKRDLEMIVTKTRELRGIPVLVTSMHRRNFDSQGKIVNTLGEYPDAVRLVAKEMDVPLIDLNKMSATLYESLGVEGSAIAFKSGDGTHHNNYGSYQLARCVIEGIRTLHLSLGREILQAVTSYTPARPDPASTFNIPPSPQTAEEKPAGN